MKIGHYARIRQHVFCARRQRDGFARGVSFRRHQPQFVECHGFHGTRGRTDIAGMRGADQDDANRHALVF
jgi:hypothetical protein